MDEEREGIEAAKRWEGLDGQDYASRVSCKESYEFGLGQAPSFDRPSDSSFDRSHATIRPFDHSIIRPFDHSIISPRVICYDFGVKTNILRSLAAFARVTVVPAQTPAADVLAQKPDGVFLSNGPADPAAVGYAIANIRELLGKVPLFGICLGHQLLSLACGAKTGRLKFGHHGCNHPVKNLATGKVEITSQNHNFAVLPESVPDCLAVTHVNLNDGSIEGVRHKTLPAFSVQYHPESCPGPHDSQYLFGEFCEMIKKEG